MVLAMEDTMARKRHTAEEIVAKRRRPTYYSRGGEDRQRWPDQFPGSCIKSRVIKAKVRYRIGWREADGPAVVSPEWPRGDTYAEFKVPERATMKLRLPSADDGVLERRWPGNGANFRKAVIYGSIDGCLRGLSRKASHPRSSFQLNEITCRQLFFLFWS